MKITRYLLGLITLCALSGVFFIYGAETESPPEQSIEQTQITGDDTTPEVSEKSSEKTEEVTAPEET